MANIRQHLLAAANPAWWRTWQRQHAKAAQYRAWAAETHSSKEREEYYRLAEVYDHNLNRMGETLAAVVTVSLQHPEVPTQVFEPDTVNPLTAAAYVQHLLACLQSESERPKAAPPSETPTTDYLFTRDGDGWFIRAFGEQGHFRNRRGLEYIAKLLARPGEPILMPYLVGGLSLAKTVSAHQAAPENLHVVHDVGSPLADSDTLAELYRKIAECKQGIADAERAEDPVEAEVMRKELDALLNELKARIRPGGKSKAFATNVDKLRVAIYQALQRTYAALRKDKMPKTADHLEAAISAEGDCYAYRPKPHLEWALKL